jgi:hypothetical protein
MRKLLHDVAGWVRSKEAATWRALGPDAEPGVARGAVADVVRSRGELVLENAMLRQQIIVLRRKCSRPRLTRLDRLGLPVGAAMLPGWRRALAIVQPETLLGWHREGFRTFWRARSRAGKVERRLAIETITLIGEMAGNNRLWGAERIRGRAPEGRYSSQQAYDPEVHALVSAWAWRTDVVDLRQKPRSRHLVLRLRSNLRSCCSGPCFSSSS